jgi:MFS family permease
MAVLSRWAGGLLDRFGARLPLIVGPAIAGVGFVLLAMPGATHSYLALLAPMIVLGLGMAITVAPLTTSVINAVPERQAGVASGINNAVASLASLLAIAILGAVALGVHNHTLERQAAAQTLSPQAREAIAGARGKFAADLTTLQGEERKAAETIVRQSLGTSISLVMGLAAALAFAAALCAALTMRPPETRTQTVAKPAAS